MELEQFLAKFRWYLPIRNQQPDAGLEHVLRRNLIKHFDLLDHPIKAQANGWIRYTILVGQLFEGARGQDQTLHKLLVLLIQMYKPSWLFSHLKINISLNKTKAYFHFIDAPHLARLLLNKRFQKKYILQNKFLDPALATLLASRHSMATAT